MARRVVYHKGRTKDNEDLVIITIFEEGLRKEDVKRLSRYSKRHDVLVPNGNFYDFNSKKV